MLYRVFIGMWDDGDPDYTSLNHRNLSWDEAKQILTEQLRLWENDTCEDCKAQAARELVRLKATEPGHFEAEVEGEDYLILEEEKNTNEQLARQDYHARQALRGAGQAKEETE